MSDEASLDDFIEDDSPSSTERRTVRMGPVDAEVPVEWEVTEMSSLYRDTTIGTSERGQGDQENIPLIKMGDLKRQELFIREASEEIEKTDELLEKYSLEKGDLLFNTRNTPELVGKTAVWDGRTTAVHDNNLLRLRFRPGISPLFANYFLSSEIGWRQLRGRVHGTTSVAAIYNGELDKIRVALPSLDEQRKIGSILYTLDLGIYKSEEIIEQTERVRTGLIQDLVKRGLTPDGTLRPTPDDEPALYKEEAGRTVPENWEVRKFSEMGDWVSGKTPRKSNDDYWQGTIPWVTAKDMKTFRVSDSEDKITEYAVEEGAPLAPADSLLILVRGLILDHTFPVVRPTQPVSFNQDVKAILPTEDVTPDYLASWLKTNSEEVLALVTTASHGTKRLATEALGNLSVPLPPVDEQAEIVDRVTQFGKKIENEKSHVNDLKRLKSGLMQDLLTGKNRTAGKEVEILDEVMSYEPQ